MEERRPGTGAPSPCALTVASLGPFGRAEMPGDLRIGAGPVATDGWAPGSLQRAHVDLPPRVVGIVRRHAGGDLRGALAEILFVDRAAVVDDEGHHARIAVFGRPGDERETA